MTERNNERPKPRTQITNARRRGRLLWLAAGVSLLASCATGRIVIEVVSPDCGVALPGSSPSRQLELSPPTKSGSLSILLRDSTGTDTSASVGYSNLGWKGGWNWWAGVTCPGWVSHMIWQEDGTFLRCAPLRVDGTVALIAREDGRIEEVRVPASESRVVDLGSGHRVRIFGFPNVGLTVEIGRANTSEVSWFDGVSWKNRWQLSDTAEVSIQMEGRTYCIFLDIAVGSPRSLRALITK